MFWWWIVHSFEFVSVEILSTLFKIFFSCFQEDDEKKLMNEKLDAEKRRMQKQYEKESDDLRRNYERKKETLSEQLEDEVQFLFILLYNVHF